MTDPLPSPLQHVFATMDESVLITGDATGAAIEWVNAAFVRDFGWDAADMVGASPLRLHARESDLFGLRALLRQLQRDGIGACDGVVRRRKDGGRLVGTLSCVRLAGADGAMRRIFRFHDVAAIDATASPALAQLQRLRQVLHEDQRELHGLRQANVTRGADDAITQREIAGLTDALGTSQRAQFATERSLAELQWQHAAGNDVAVAARDDLRHHNQRLREVNQLLDDRLHSAEHQCAALQAELDHNHRAYADLLAALSLELRAPLLQIAASDPRARRLLTLLDAMLGLAEPAPVELRAGAIETIVARAMALVRGEADRRDVRLTVERTRCDGFAIDPHGLLGCMVELIGGAIRHSDPGSEVAVTCRGSNEFLLVTVQDGGNRPERNDGAHDEPQAETGFSRLRALVDGLCGTLSIESRAGRRTTVQLALPRLLPAQSRNGGGL